MHPEGLFKFAMVFLVLEGVYRLLTGANVLFRGLVLHRTSATSSVIFAILEIPIAASCMANQRHYNPFRTKLVMLSILVLSLILVPVLFLGTRDVDRSWAIVSEECRFRPPFYNEHVTRADAVHMCEQRVANLRIARHFLSLFRLLLQAFLIRIVVVWRRSTLIDGVEEFTLNNDALNLQARSEFVFTPNPLLHGRQVGAVQIVAVDNSVPGAAAPPYQRYEIPVPHAANVHQHLQEVLPLSHAPRYTSSRNPFVSRSVTTQLPKDNSIGT